MKQLFKTGQHFGHWTLKSYLGGGGNGEVWQCINKAGEIRAIKILKRIKAKSYLRFKDETFVIEQNADIVGIIPILEKFLPEKIGEQSPYFIMPVAEASERKLLNDTIEEKVEAIIEVAKTLSELHKRKIYHRDIKPANILYYDSRYHLADFGLVDYPDKKEISVKNEEIGAKWTMAPEMRRESSNADGAKADVYSLAKTLWIFLTGRNKGFDGQYSIESIIDLKKFYNESYTSPIDNLLIACTDNDPGRRFSIQQFISELELWKKLTKDFHKRNLQQWFEIQTRLFPTSMPTRVIWEDLNDIVKVLKLVCSFDNLNHVFFPNGGGLDLRDAKPSFEEGCIELNFQSIHVLKPKRLLFETFGYEHQWNFFRLELDELKISGVNAYDEDGESYIQQQGREEVSELSEGNYFPSDILYYRENYERDYLITNFSRLIKRWLRGNFVIFSKRSIYNLIPDTYDARHNKMSADAFRNYIEGTLKIIRQKEAKKEIFDLPFNGSSLGVKTNLKHLVEEVEVNRCGWCGSLVDTNGNELDENTWLYTRKVIEKFGDRVVKRVTGNCCKHKN